MSAPYNSSPGGPKRISDFIRNFFSYQLVAQQKYGQPSYSLPLWLVLLIIIPLHQLVLFLLIFALLVGYRLHLEQK
jgi:hypothetical protein